MGTAAPSPFPASSPASSVAEQLAHFGPGTLLWDDLGDWLYLMCLTPAFVLQVMHPVIGAAVAEHSDYLTDPMGRFVRSIDSTQFWVYGGDAAVEEVDRLRVMHRSIQGKMPDGSHYAALDLEAWAWVHGSGYVTAVASFPYRWGRQPTEAQLDQMYDEHLRIGRLLAVSETYLHPTRAEYWEYYDWLVAERLQHTETAQHLMGLIRRPTPVRLLPGPLDPVGKLGRMISGEMLQLLTIAGMRPNARELLGVSFTDADDARLRSIMRVVRPAYARLPERVRYTPLAYAARRYQRQIDEGRERRRVR